MAKSKYDWQAIELHYMTTGMSFTDTSKAFGVPVNSIIQRSKRKQWKTPGNAVRKIEEGKRELQELRPEIVTLDPVQAVKATIEEQRDKFIGGISSGLSRAAEEIGRMDAGTFLASSKDIKAVVDSGKVIYNLGGETSSASVSINLLNMDASMLAGQVKVSPSL
jgi:hypothetical protein